MYCTVILTLLNFGFLYKMLPKECSFTLEILVKIYKIVLNYCYTIYIILCILSNVLVCCFAFYTSMIIKVLLLLHYVQEVKLGLLILLFHFTLIINISNERKTNKQS